MSMATLRNQAYRENKNIKIDNKWKEFFNVQLFITNDLKIETLHI